MHALAPRNAADCHAFPEALQGVEGWRLVATSPQEVHSTERPPPCFVGTFPRFLESMDDSHDSIVTCKASARRSQRQHHVASKPTPLVFNDVSNSQRVLSFSAQAAHPIPALR
jgi:hypothetical protein